MKHQFILRKKGYHDEIRQMILRGLLFIFSFVGIMIIIFYLTGFDLKELFSSKFAFSVLIPICVPILFQLPTGWRQAKIRYKSYKVIFEDNYLLQEQLGFWEEVFFLMSNHDIKRNRMPYREITEIRKSETGYYTIKGSENSYPNTIIISAHIANIKGLEERLSEIKPIKLHNEVNNLREYPVNKISITSAKSLFFHKQTIKVIFGFYFGTLSIAYLWFNPINWPLVIFLSIVYFSCIFLGGYYFTKYNNKVSPIVVDKTAIIAEREKGNPIVFPFNELTSVTKQSFQFVIVGKKISTSLPNQLVIPTNIEGIDSFEQKLNATCPIKYLD